MKILVNAIPLVGLLTGISRYVRQLYHELEQLSNVEVFYFDGIRVHRQMPDQAVPEKWIRDTAGIWKLPAPVVFSLRSLFWLKYEWMLRRVCRSDRYDIYHETGFLPAAVRGIPIAYTIHDLSLSKFRHTHPKERVWFNDFFFSRRISYATHVLTVSDFVRQEIFNTIHIPDRRISAIHLAPSSVFYPRQPEHIGKIQKQYGISENYLLFVGSLEPRKNLPFLVQALQRCRTKIPLVLAGWEGWGDKDWLKSISGSDLKNRIIMTGYIDDETLACLYSGASAFVYPSIYEGFGLPILEAMACGCPVICSKAASMPEVAGDSAIQIDPNDLDDLANAIDRIVADANLRHRMIESGFSRIGRFTWRKTAETTLAVFEKIISEAKPK
jgi:glycosyltransferase involved in cell wall biosynthesis